MKTFSTIFEQSGVYCDGCGVPKVPPKDIIAPIEHQESEWKLECHQVLGFGHLVAPYIELSFWQLLQVFRLEVIKIGPRTHNPKVDCVLDNSTTRNNSFNLVLVPLLAAQC